MREKNILWMALMALLLTSLLTASTVTPSPGTEVRAPTIVDPGLEIGDTFDVDITIVDVPNLYGWSVKLDFNPMVLNAIAVAQPTPNFLGPATTWSAGIQMPLIDNFMGFVRIGDLLLGIPPEGVSGSGTLATITFEVIMNASITPLEFDVEKTKLYTYEAGWKMEIPHETIDGLVDSRATVLGPIALFDYDPPTVVEGSPVSFDAKSSSDPDGGWIVSYFWDFGDGTNATGVTVDHAYTLEGSYIVKLNVTDIDDLSDTITHVVTVVDWITGGIFVDLVGKCAWPQKRQLKEYWGDRTNELYAKIGNPTDAPMQAYVEFTLWSRDELRVLGTLTTETVTVDPHKKEVLTVLFDTYGNPQWSCVSGGDWWPYGYIVWLRKYLVLVQCYSFRDGDWKPGNVVKDFQFKVSPASHDIAILSATANDTEVYPGDLVAVDVVVENQGPLDELFDVTVRHKEDVHDIQSVALLAGENTTVTLIFDSTGISAPKTCVLWVELPKPAVIYEKDYTDQYALVVVDVVLPP